MLDRWWIYQRERFPVFAHGLLIAAFSFSAVSFSALLRGPEAWPEWTSIGVAFATSFFFFLQLRIADEFKDFEEDARFRPYRPVQRGLVSLRELGWLFAFTAGLQLILGAWLAPSLILLLLGVWTYLVLMSKEFFIGDWLRARPIPYMLSHMMIMPLIDFYATACDWWNSGSKPIQGLLIFVVVSYFNGLVIEIGRKIRAPVDEEPGVNTYSVLWGRRRAVLVWLILLAITGGFAVFAAWQVDFAGPVACVLGALFVAAILVVIRFLQSPIQGRGKRIEMMAGLWTIGLYLSLGAVPLLWRWITRNG